MQRIHCVKIYHAWGNLRKHVHHYINSHCLIWDRFVHVLKLPLDKEKNYEKMQQILNPI
jgi:hypothetical protein